MCHAGDRSYIDKAVFAKCQQRFDVRQRSVRQQQIRLLFAKNNNRFEDIQAYWNKDVEALNFQKILSL